ncbi:uncharacterized protein EHS24_008432 [Apiotrichum porosum]|uniref:Uncharacterized protein n=1 Tax=Apiotrichum porosum TaxID=105984 RepID=A0A427XQA7_9TREE|nr:uncharacterized protein EHS24_008432 [Apiotrichum porosum]RSH81000.1 hypothetical protein EHS24_008432 [Apiotrichum porosum]
MPLAIRPVVSAPLAACCTVLSIFGVIILATFGALYARRAEALVGSIHDTNDPDYTSKICYTAAFVYACFIGFCGLQLTVHQRYPRGVQL